MSCILSTDIPSVIGASLKTNDYNIILNRP